LDGDQAYIADDREKQEMYFRLLLESCPDPMIIFDENTKFLLGTKSVTDIIGVNDISDLNGKSLDEIVEKYRPPVFNDAITTQIRTIVSERGNVVNENKYDVSTGIKEYEVKVLPFRKDTGDFTGILVIMHDATEIMRAKDIAEQASLAKGEFVSRMSHEIRTPLNAIIGMISIGLDSSDIEKKNYCFMRADSASKHLLSIINDILDMSKIEADKLEMSYSAFDFEQALKNITNIASVRAEEKNQNFIVNLGDGVPAFIISDELRISQVITNLLTNAIKFTPEKGTITLNADKIEEIDKEVELRIEVTDTGIGISKAQQERLFTSFYQADSSIYQKFGGTGLGLVISKRIVELMGGKIWVESEPGNGAKFTFTIKAQKTEGISRTKLSDKIDKDKLRILAVDDSEETRDYFKHVMGALKLICDVAPDGPHAVNMVKNSTDKPYNIFFVDWQMPGMDGIELTRKIKEINGDNSIVIMISAHDWSIVEKEASAAGVRHFISKPLFPSTLINAINICIGDDKSDFAGDVQRGLPGRRYDFYDHTLLIAEDVEINREIMSAVLEETEVSIDYAENGKIAVAMFRENPEKYSLILMDINMPEMDGYEATRQIRSLDLAWATEIPIVAMTANVFKEDIEKCLASGMNDHTGKPVDANALFGMLNQFLTNPSKKGNMKNIYALEHGIAWDDGLLTGNALVDLQHHRIFEKISDLVLACEEGRSTEKLEDMLVFLINYTIRHFTDEEALQLEYNYPDYQHHKKEHDDFRATVANLVQKLKESGSSAELSSDVNRIVVRWLINHINSEDKKLSDHIRSITVRTGD